jgi:transcription antitermination factor NusG
MTGDLAKVYRALNGTQIGVGTIIGYGDANPINAEARPGTTAAWYVVETLPSHERIAAGHLSGRRFGVYVPEVERTEMRAGRKIKAVRPMFPGYLFVFTWGIKDNAGKIMACPGVWRMMLIGDRFAVLPDEAIDVIRAEENKHRPLSITIESVSLGKRKYNGWRKIRRENQAQQAIEDNQIVSVRAWSAFTDGLRQAVDGGGRNQILRKILGLAS